MAEFCVRCGAELIDGVCPKCAQGGGNRTDERFKRFFVSPKEKLVTTLGNTYIQNFLSNGSISRGFAVVSDKRMYFQGTTYELITKNSGKKKMIKRNKSRVVDLKDVTGSGYDRYSSIIAMIMAIILLVLAFLFGNHWLAFLLFGYDYYSVFYGLKLLCLLFFIIGLIALAYYFHSKKTLLAIQFAGGEIGFDIRWFSEKEIADFQKQLRLAKDRAIEEADNEVANKLQEAVSSAAVTQKVSQPVSVADELTKYANLLAQGLITQEEFDKKKKELL